MISTVTFIPVTNVTDSFDTHLNAGLRDRVDEAQVGKTILKILNVYQRVIDDLPCRRKGLKGCGLQSSQCNSHPYILVI